MLRKGYAKEFTCTLPKVGDSDEELTDWPVKLMIMAFCAMLHKGYAKEFTCTLPKVGDSDEELTDSGFTVEKGHFKQALAKHCENCAGGLEENCFENRFGSENVLKTKTAAGL